jgi:uncharacterized protein (TIGR02147 family)
LDLPCRQMDKDGQASIFTYDNYRRFLSDYFERQRAQNKNFSLRFFAQRVGFKSHSFCDKVVRGERNLTLESVLKIGKALKLAKPETDYFQYLVLYNQAKTYQEKQDYFQELTRLRRKLEFYRIQEEQYAYFSSWIYQVVREAAVYGDWKGDYKRLGQTLVPPISEKEAEDAVTLLVQTGFLKKAPGGRYVQANPVVSGQGCPPHIIKNVRTQFIFKALEAGETVPKERRHLSYSTLAISRKHFEEIAGMLDEVRRKILSRAVEDPEVHEIFSLNFQLYPLTQGLKNASGTPGEKP